MFFVRLNDSINQPILHQNAAYGNMAKDNNLLKKWIAKVLHRIKNNHFQALIYSMRDLPKNEISGLEVISFDDRIFSVPIYVDILSEIRQRANGEKIPRFSMFVRKRKDKIEVTSIVPSSASKEYVKILLELSKSRPDGSIDLDAYIKYEESIWDWA